ncbi:MAG TPA: methyltransferase domain-containing protein [Candidatus Polarisedimenticolia bacterium]|nr:methyltransferase domain-containing protein [Candidatus Polarisedimenticolia bacterium]
MTDPNAHFTGSIPENYDRHLGPVLFEPYARDLARRLPAAEGTRVLEIACGTGIVTRQLRERLPAGARLVATDLNQPMIDHARRRLEGVRGIDWQQADACALPFPDKSFDVVVCQFGLMFVPDKPLALKEARRVLADGGTLLLSVWDSLEKNTFAKIAHEKIASFFPSDPPTFYQVPFSLHDMDALQEMASGAGFTEVRIDPVAFQGESPTARELATGLVEGNPVGSAIRERNIVPVADVISAVALTVAKQFGDRPVRIPLHAFVMTARAGAR